MGTGLNEGYAKSTKGILKIIVIITTCIAFALMIDAFGGWSRHSAGNYDFFVSIHIAAFVVSIVIFLVFLISLDNTLGSTRCWNILNLIASIIFGILCIVTSGLMTEYTSDWLGRTNGRIVAGYIAGFISGIVFLIDAVIHFKEVR